MKKMVGMVMVLGLVMVFSGVALAAGTNTVTVTANVSGTCAFNTATSTLAFGSLDPSSGAPVNGNTSVTFWCSNGTSYSIGDDDGLHELAVNGNRMEHTSTAGNFIPYSFSYNPATGTGSGRTTDITLNISGSVAFADYQNALVGDYSDTVLLTITP